jgi:Flp pilus assembly pilin Flp
MAVQIGGEVKKFLVRLADRVRTEDESQRGATIVEYFWLMGFIGITLIGIVNEFGGNVTNSIETAGAPLGGDTTEVVEDESSDDESDAPETQVLGASTQIDDFIALEETAPGLCPNGWDLLPVTVEISTKKKGQSVDANGDGMICRKDIPGGGEGNTGQNKNVKDNNGAF